MSTDKLVTPITPEQVTRIAETNETYQIQITLDDLINSQLSKVS